MLDINFIRENPDAVKDAIKKKRITLNLDELLELDEKRRGMIAKSDDLRRKRKDISEKVQSADAVAKKRLIGQGKKNKEELAAIEAGLKTVEARYIELMYLVPNISSDDTPVGGDQDFKVVETAGEPPDFGFEIKNHIELGRSLDILDLERGVKTAGYRGYYLKNEGALLHMAVLAHAYKKMAQNGFTPMITPTLIREFALIGSGHFPTGRQEIYEAEEYSEGKEKEVKYLAGTAEPALLAYRADEILDETELPVKLAGISPCYRREVGGYGQDTKGIYRIHEFMKVEQIVICRNDIEESEKWFSAMMRMAQEILRELELPYRVIHIASADAGPGKYKQYDIETWMPGRNGYGETHSCSNLTDWQMRRLNIRFRDKQGNMHVPFALNNTVIASPRILIAILENNQQEDGSVKVPKILQEFVGKEILEPKNNGQKKKT